jgi:hypothetical protein
MAVRLSALRAGREGYVYLRKYHSFVVSSQIVYVKTLECTKKLSLLFICSTCISIVSSIALYVCPVSSMCSTYLEVCLFVLMA